jgi:site-specific DNA-methyltransferase (adenine-specific)
MSEINLIHGDCLEEMKNIPDGSVDMVLTDPPYGMSYQSNYREKKHSKIENDSNLDWLDDFCKEMFRVSKDNTAHYVFTSFHNIDIFKQKLQLYFKVKNILVWEKNNTSMGDLEGDFAPKIEFVIFLHKGVRKINGSRDPNIFKFNKTANDNHPTEKPVGLCEYLMGKFSDEGHTILDPFMGSGTTGVAARATDRNFIGIEKDESYFNIAKKRIEAPILTDFFK